MEFGYELEFFPVKNGQVVTLQNSRMSRDDCGFLAEAISEPSNDVRKSIAFLKIAVDRLHEWAKKEKIKLLREPLRKVDDELLREARTFAGKDPLDVQNIYGHVSDPYQTDHYLHGASLQVSFNKPFSYTARQGKRTWTSQVSELFDFTGLIRHLDQEFKEEIAAAKRNPGFYALKHGSHGTRVEYRSLPNNVSLDKLQKVLLKYVGGY